MIIRVAQLFVLVSILFSLTGCSMFLQSVKDKDPLTASSLTAKYDQRDMLSMPAEAVDLIVAHPFPPQGMAPPLMAELGIQNLTRSHIEMQPLADTITTKMLNTGKFRLVNTVDRDKLLKEQGYQLANCPLDKRVMIGKQLGAQYMLTGSLAEQSAESGREVRVSKKEDITYMLTLKVTDLETGETRVQKQVVRMRRASKPLIGW